MNATSKFAPLFAASRAGMPLRRDGETAPTVIVVVRPPKPAPQFKVGDKVYLDSIQPSAPFVAEGGLVIRLVNCEWIEGEVDEDGRREQFKADGRPYGRSSYLMAECFPGFWAWKYEAVDSDGVCYDDLFILQSEATPQHMLQEKINTGNLDLWDGPEARAKTKAAYEEWVAAGRPETDFTRKIFDDPVPESPKATIKEAAWKLVKILEDYEPGSTCVRDIAEDLRSALESDRD